jgi:hypothetical protein
MRVFLFSCLLMLCLPGCSHLASKALQKPLKKLQDNRVGQALLIGTIEMVNPEQNYVLIHCDSRPTLDAGVELIALDSNGNKSKLVVTPERKGNYLTADIKEGMPAVGSLALQKVQESDTLPAAPATTNGQPASPAPTVEMPIERPPPIPEIQFPSTPAQSTTGELPLPSTVEPVPDPSTLPPVIR